MTKYHFKFNLQSTWNDDPVDALVFPFWRKKDEILPAFYDANIAKTIFSLKPLLEDFRGKKGEMALFYSQMASAKRIILLGLGEVDELNIFAMREAYHALIHSLRKKNVEHLGIIFPDKSKEPFESVLQALSETVILSSYLFTELQSSVPKDLSQVKEVTIIGVDPKYGKICQSAQDLCKGVYFTRNLINRNADDVTPSKLGEIAQSLADLSPHIKVSILDKKQIEKEKMGLILAVSKGSDLEPRLIHVTYTGNKNSKEHVALLGKGITYDTGGLSLKPTEYMLDMKSDMSGAATVLGVIYSLALRKAKVNVSAVIASAENAIGSRSYKIGDVYTSYSGKTVEITNTDAEGRLVMADALTYIEKKLQPKAVIDLATLTGGVIVALGEEICGYFSNDEDLATKIDASAKSTDELIWRLPLHKSYHEMLKSKVADMKNSAGREASAIQGALFLEKFIEHTPWAHLDIAGTAFLNKPKGYNGIFATGYGVRMLVHMLENLA